MKLQYIIKYNDFDIFTEGTMYLDCSGSVLDKGNLDITVDCSFKNITIGKLNKCEISHTLSAIVNNGKGDVNGDGKVNAIDASIVLDMYYNLVMGNELTETEKINFENADVNCDGRVNAIDATLILSYYSNKSSGVTIEDDMKIIKCDVNNDDVVNIDDYNLLKSRISNNIFNEKCDLNDDGILDNKDIEFFKKVMYDFGSKRR
jgi:hypothetical protein